MQSIAPKSLIEYVQCRHHSIFPLSLKTGIKQSTLVLSVRLQFQQPDSGLLVFEAIPIDHGQAVQCGAGQHAVIGAWLDQGNGDAVGVLVVMVTEPVRLHKNVDSATQGMLATQLLAGARGVGRYGFS